MIAKPTSVSHYCFVIKCGSSVRCSFVVTALDLYITRSSPFSRRVIHYEELSSRISEMNFPVTVALPGPFNHVCF